MASFADTYPAFQSAFLEAAEASLTDPFYARLALEGLAQMLEAEGASLSRIEVVLQAAGKVIAPSLVSSVPNDLKIRREFAPTRNP